MLVSYVIYTILFNISEQIITFIIQLKYTNIWPGNFLTVLVSCLPPCGLMVSINSRSHHWGVSVLKVPDELITIIPELLSLNLFLLWLLFQIWSTLFSLLYHTQQYVWSISIFVWIMILLFCPLLKSKVFMASSENLDLVGH